MLALCAASASRAEAANSQLSGLAPYTWKHIDTGPPRIRYVGIGYTDCTQTRNLPGPVGRDFSGLDYGNGQIFYWGGGHAGHPGNDVELFDTDSNVWTQALQPECYPLCCTDDTHCDPGCGSMGGGANMGVSPLGRPYAEHTYDRQAFHQRRGTWFVAPGSGTWEFNPATSTWERWTTSNPTSGDIANKHIMYDPNVSDGLGNSGTMLWISLGTDDKGVHRLDMANRRWVYHGNIPSGLVWKPMVSAYDPVGQRHLIHVNTHSLWWYTSAPSAWTRITSIPAQLVSGTSWAFDTSRNTVVAASHQGDVTRPISIHEYVPATNSWSAIAMSGTPPCCGTAANGVLEYDSSHNVFWFINVANVGAGGSGGMTANAVQMWVFRTGSSPPLGTATATGGVSTATRTPTAPAQTPTPVLRTNTPLGSTTPNPDLDVALTIRELLPANDAGGANPVDVTGRARVNEPVTFGIPLRATDGITNTNQLGVRDMTTGGLVPAQFRELPPRDAAGRIKWVLVDVQASLGANASRTNLHLVRVSATPTPVPLASTGADSITVDTGVATFSLRGSRFNLIDRAVVRGTTLTAPGHNGGIAWRGPDGIPYESALDPTSTIVLEENGPLRAVVKAQGRMRSVAGTAAMGFTARLHFYRDHSYVRVQVSVENGFRDDLTRKLVTNVGLRQPVTLPGTDRFVFATQSGTENGTIQPGTVAYLYHGRTSHKVNSDAVRSPGAPESFFIAESDFGAVLVGAGQDGFTIVNGTSTLVPFGGINAYSRGFADLSDEQQRGLSVAMRDFDSFYPSAIELAPDGRVSVEIASQRNTAQPLSFDWGVHETRDVVLDFHDGAPDPTLTHYRAQYPLFGRAAYEQYRDTGAFLGRTELVTFAEMVAYHAGNDAGIGINQFAATNEPSYGVTSYTMPNQQIVRTRAYDWSEGGRQTNNDLSAPKLLTFLQTGHGGQFQSAYNLVHFIVDQAFHRSDRQDRATWPLPDPELAVVGPITNRLNGGASTFEQDMEHENTLGVVLFYYLTGDEGVREGLIDHGEWLAHAKAFATPVECAPGQRGAAQRAKWFAVLHEFTGDPRHWEQLQRAVDKFLCGAIVNPNDITDQGQDMDRGYYYSDGNPASPREIGTGPLLFVRTEALMEMLRALPSTDPRKEELADRLLGYAYFVARETYFDRDGDLCRGFGAPLQGSSYLLDAAPEAEAVRPLSSMQNHLASISHGFALTKEDLFKYVGQRVVSGLGTIDQVFCDYTHMIGQSYFSYASWPAQMFMYLDQHESEFGSVFLNDDPATAGGLDVTNNGGGSYTLRWTVSEGAQRYQIKYGPQPMVPNLNFNRATRTYQYSPSTHDNFWAGNAEAVTNQPRNITNEPLPAAPGTVQTFVVSGLDPTKTHRFALRIYGATAAPSAPPSAPTLL